MDKKLPKMEDGVTIDEILQFFSPDLANKIGAVLAAEQPSLTVGTITMANMCVVQIMADTSRKEEERRNMIRILASFLGFMADNTEIQKIPEPGPSLPVPQRKLDS